MSAYIDPTLTNLSIQSRIMNPPVSKELLSNPLKLILTNSSPHKVVRGERGSRKSANVIINQHMSSNSSFGTRFFFLGGGINHVRELKFSLLKIVAFLDIQMVQRTNEVFGASLSYRNIEFCLATHKYRDFPQREHQFGPTSIFETLVSIRHSLNR